jgi:hypothetical protein
MTGPFCSWIVSIIGRDDLAVSRHQAKLAVLAIVCLVVVIAILRPAFWKRFWEPTRPSGQATPMSRLRLLVAYGLLAFIVGGTIPDAVMDSEHWPWSVYPMYSYMWVGQKYDDYRLYGVPKDHPDQEFSLFTDERYLQPFDQSRMGAILTQLINTPGRPDVHAALIDCLKRYEALRRGGRHPGPELTTLRLYHVFWTLDSYGSTIEKPDRKVEIDEVSLADAEKS